MTDTRKTDAAMQLAIAQSYRVAGVHPTMEVIRRAERAAAAAWNAEAATQWPTNASLDNAAYNAALDELGAY